MVSSSTNLGLSISFLVTTTSPPLPSHFCLVLNKHKNIASGVHKEYGYQKTIQSIKNSLIDVYHRFPLQSFELLDGGTQVIKTK